MLVLALDTSTRAGSVAVADAGQVLVEATGDAGRLLAERLPGWLLDTLSAAGRSLTDVDRLAVLSGPGGFTGLRVGLATIQGLAFALPCEVFVASTLEVLAWGAALADPQTAITGVWMRGMRGEIFTALYDVLPADTPDAPPSRLRARLGPLVASPAVAAVHWADALRPAGAALSVTGDAWDSDGDALRAVLPAGLLTWVPVGPPAGLLARLAGLPAARTVPPHAVAPTYVRQPDAVVTRERASLASPGER